MLEYTNEFDILVAKWNAAPSEHERKMIEVEIDLLRQLLALKVEYRQELIKG